METTKLSSKGQIVLPKSIRKSHQWKTGVEFIVEDTEQGILLRPSNPFKPTTWDAVVGCVDYKGKTKTIKAMKKAIATELKKRHARGRY